MKALRLLLKTNNSLAPLIARLTLGIVMSPHGTQKALGLFGGDAAAVGEESKLQFSANKPSQVLLFDLN
jgi:uncharacterized membrane protein YphA (DoxX/SURF4 family)